ncbi:hypothetical protein Bhyg_02867 [Pseudolycoriella hygida]|uniref:Uncharacterized protein n=1 Tax=Pseudolycoriella hygida TaxID=35572 RepID=A0A9Q0NE32_9DIPT|nr:hypothetical protein Bhyg_02867 [Pseudolycoriella hygida]
MREVSEAAPSVSDGSMSRETDNYIITKNRAPDHDQDILCIKHHLHFDDSSGFGNICYVPMLTLEKFNEATLDPWLGAETSVGESFTCNKTYFLIHANK